MSIRRTLCLLMMCALAGALGACSGSVEGSASIGEGGTGTAGDDSSTGGTAGSTTGGSGGEAGTMQVTGGRSGAGGTQSGTGGSSGSGGGGASSPRSAAKVYYFGHSLVDFGAPDTQVGSAMCSIAASSGHSCCADGEYPTQFDPTAFSNYPLPPEPGQQHEPSCTEDWNGSYSASNLDTVVITDVNFIYRGPTETSVAAGRELVNNIRSTDPSIPIFLYEHWPELEGQVSFDSWKSSDYRTFATWFEAVQDGINGDIDGAPVKLIPAGRVITRLLRDVPALAALGQDDLFVDTDPHGTPVTYFLSGIAHYMAIYGQKPATDGAAIGRLPSYLPEAVRANYAQIVDVAWSELQAVHNAGGEVF